MRRAISIILCLVLTLSASAFAVPFSAAEANITQSATQQDDIASIGITQVGSYGRPNKFTQWYGLTDDWCVMFVCWCANQAGVSTSIIPKLAGSTRMMNWFDGIGRYHSRSSGYTPQKGDLVFFERNSNFSDGPDHTGLVTGCSNGYVYTVEGNTSGNQVKQYSYSLSNSNIWGYGNPAYEDSIKPVDVGTNFYAYIINTSTWLHATNNDYGNVTASSVAYTSNQIWYFERLNNGSYKITSCKDGRCMEVHNFESANGTNVEMNSYGNNTAQHWFISGNSAEYVFQAECGNNVLILNGSNLQMWESNGSSAEKFQIWKLTAPNLSAVNVSVSNYGGKNGENIKLSWDECQDATGYDIRIYDESGSNNLKMFYNVKGTSYTISLPSGNYIAEVTALNSRFNMYKFGNRTSFSCANNLGNDFYGYIINTASWKKLVNDGSHHAVFNEQVDENNKVWHFVLNENGSYTIYSLYDNNVLDVDLGKSESGTNVGVWQYGDSSNQEWYVYGESAVYYFQPNCSDCVLDMEGGTYYDGVNARIFKKNNTDAQKFQIWRLSKPEAAFIVCEAGTGLTTTTFSWTKTYNTHSYALNIWKDTDMDVEPYLTVDCGNETSYKIVLPEGHYIASVVSVNNNGSTASKNNAEFEIEKSLVLGDANGDSEVDLTDAAFIQRYCTGIDTGIDEATLMHGDVDDSGELELTDATFIQRYVTGFVVPYPIGKTYE